MLIIRVADPAGGAALARRRRIEVVSRSTS
jgi:hypothetical protein